MKESRSRIDVVPYSPSKASEWNTFVASAKNATFLFNRGYMDYHADRFEDRSLMIYREGSLQAALPAHRVEAHRIASHEGLTYGGLILARSATLRGALSCFGAALAYLSESGYETLNYKCFPRFYNSLPCDELEYALFLLDARLYRRDCAIVAPLADRLPLRKGRKHQIKKAQRVDLDIREEGDFGAFWSQALEPRLHDRYQTRPVHTVAEMRLLKNRFPQCIRQFSAYLQDRLLAGVTIYETDAVAHAQYIAVTEEGQETGALDALCAWLLDTRYSDKRYFDFGTCCENGGRVLNEGLLAWKESFGGRACSQDFYEIETGSYKRLYS